MSQRGTLMLSLAGNMLTLSDTVPLPSGDEFRITVSLGPDACHVSTETCSNIVTVGWDQITDVELLSHLFEFETVIVFKAIVKMLSIAYNFRSGLV